MAKRAKQYFIGYDSDRFDRNEWDIATQRYGTYHHTTCDRFSTIRSAKAGISNIRKYYADENPRNFVIYDSFADVDEKTNFVPVIWHE